MTKRISASSYIAQAQKLVPDGYKVCDTGAPRGERNLFYVQSDKGVALYENFSAKRVLDWVKAKYYKEQTNESE